MVLEVYGAIIGILELSIFFGGTILIKRKTAVFKNVDNFSYYWLCFTILTGIHRYPKFLLSLKPKSISKYKY